MTPDIEPWRPTNTVRGLILCIGAMDKAPLSQSLYLQTYIAENLEGFFKTCPSVYREILAPFFVAYWERAIAETTGEFRCQLDDRIRRNN